MLTRWFPITALVLLALLVLAACAPAAAPTAAPPTQAAAPTQPPATQPPAPTAAATTAPTTAPTEAATTAPTTAATTAPTVAATTAATTTTPSGNVIKATPGKAVKMVLLPKFLGIAVFDQAHNGAEEAAKELQNPTALTFTGPTADNSVQGQIETVTNAATQGVQALMISNNAGDQIAPAAQALQQAGGKVIAWDSPIPSAKGENLFIAQVDFAQTGKVMADMALDILGANGGDFAVLSASPDAANQNAWIASLKDTLKDPKYAKLNLLDVVYGNDQSEASYNQALALVDKYPSMKLIMAPTTVGIAAAAKAMQDNNLCDKIKVSGLGLPSENVSYVKNGCEPEFALWSFTDLGYLTYYASYLMATGALQGKEGETFEAGRMGNFTIQADPTRAGTGALRVVMGPFSVYNKDNIDKEVGGSSASPTAAAGPTAAPTSAPSSSGSAVTAKPGQSVKMLLLPKFLGIAIFDQAHNGAEEAAKELQNPTALTYTGPTADNSVQGQIETVTNAATQGYQAIMVSNNAGDQLSPAAQAFQKAGGKYVAWDSPIPSAAGENLFIAQVDFAQTGKVMADMALDILGADGGDFAVLSASPDAANQNAWIASLKTTLQDPKYSKLKLLDVVYGNDQSEASYNQALALVDKYPSMKLIMAPTTVGIAAAAKAMQDNNLCDKIKVSGLGLPSENVSYVKNGCEPEFALWSFTDLGYLTYYAAYLLATGGIQGKAGEQFNAGRMGTFTIEADPTRPNTSALRVIMGPFSVYNKDNIDKAVGQ